MSKFKITILLILLVHVCRAQVSINSDSTSADASAILDVSSTEKGMLVPRMTSAQRELINNPATGLLVFDMDSEGFWFYNGATWIDLSAGDNLGDHTATQDIDLNNFRVSNGTAGTGLKINNGGKGTLQTDQSETIGLELLGGDTPALRIHQNGSQNWPDYTWDIAGNESSFFVRDVNNASNLPLQIISGSANNRVTIKGNNVGIGTNDPNATLDVNGPIRMRQGATAGYIPIASPEGVMIWTDPDSAGLADNLGDHIATDTLRLAGHMITNGNSVYGIAINGDGNVHGTAKDHTPNMILETHDSPFLRFDQTYAGGYSPYTWDLGGHESYFFLNDEVENTYPLEVYTGQSNHRLVLRNDNVGIGVNNPNTALDVNGQIRMRQGSAAGFIPVADANGVMTWTDPDSTGLADNLGDHTATQDLDLNNFNIENAGTVDADTVYAAQINGYKLPVSDGLTGQRLSTDGNGILGWTYSGDNLGNHRASQNLQMLGEWITFGPFNDDGIMIEESGDVTFSDGITYSDDNLRPVGTTLPMKMACVKVDIEGSMVGNNNTGVQSVSNPSAGVYTITFDPGTFSEAPIVNVNALTAGNIATVSTSSTTETQIVIMTLNGNFNSTGFWLTAIGQ